MKNKDGNDLPIKVDKLLTKGTLSARDGKILAKWYLEETGIDKQNCMCSVSQRREIQETIKEYLRELPNNK